MQAPNIGCLSDDLHVSLHPPTKSCAQDALMAARRSDNSGISSLGREVSDQNHEPDNLKRTVEDLSRKVNNQRGGDGARDRNRTCDLRVTSALLYRLSYTGGGLNLALLSRSGNFAQCLDVSQTKKRPAVFTAGHFFTTLKRSGVRRD